MRERQKVSVIGAGNVGASLAQLLAQSGLCDIMLFDIAEGMPQGKALDLAEACPLWGSSSAVKGTNGLADTKGSSVIVITAGLARKPGMSRDDLLLANARIVGGIAEKIPALSPDAVIIAVTNPMDVMAQLVREKTGFPSQRVVGMGGVLDSARLRAFIAAEAGVAPGDVQAIVMGGHGNQMVPVESLMTVKGIPARSFLGGEKIQAIIGRTRNGGAEIVSLLKTGSAYYAPAASGFEMVKAVLLDEKKVLPCAVYLEGQYGASGVYAGVPVVLGKAGVEKIIEVPLLPEEAAAFDRSVSAVRSLLSKLKNN
ncbi:MAG: malate dehydrogenase [Nitrospiraceae bacterium]|nr:malate dehydrogenase [Nitrospiraceae bacterium]